MYAQVSEKRDQVTRHMALAFIRSEAKSKEYLALSQNSIGLSAHLKPHCSGLIAGKPTS